MIHHKLLLDAAFAHETVLIYCYKFCLMLLLFCLVFVRETATATELGVLYIKRKRNN